MIKKTKKTAKRVHHFLTEKRIHWLVYGAVVLCSGSIFLQLVFPSDYTLPFTKLDQVDVGNLQRTQLIETLHARYEHTKVSIKIPGKQTEQVALGSTGYVPQYNEAARSALKYPLWQRFIPFSAVFRQLAYRPTIPQEIDAEIFEQFAHEVTDRCKKAPADAAIEIKNNQVSLRSAVPGQVCETPLLRKQLELYLLGQPSITVLTTPVLPTLTNEKVMSQFMQAKRVVETDITLASPHEQWKVPRETVAQWLTVTSHGSQAVLSINQDAIKKYLSEYRGKTYSAPGQTTIQILDGIEVKRVTGASGRGIDIEVSSKRISDGLLRTDIPNTIWLQVVALPATEVITRQYSQTHAGLQALIEQWDRDHSARYGILIRDLSGRGLNAALNADRDFITASTYKQFLAYAVMHKIEAGQMSFDDRTNTGLSVRGCIDEMILHSTNPCAIALMGQADWGWVHNFIQSQFPSTHLNNGANSDNQKHSTVRDELTFQTRLHDGTLQMNSNNHTYLLSLLKRQVYRSGIPRGVPGWTVANKVGFYNGYKHDIGIIYGPRGAYQLGIMSYGGNDSQFADLSRRVAELLGR